MPARTEGADVTVLEAAAEDVARDLVVEPQADLAADIPPALRAEGPPAPAVGCPCGCPDTELVRRVRLGDDDALATLLTRYRTLARHKARSYFLLGADREDVVQEGMIGLYKAIRDFDPAAQVPFRSFAEMCVTRQVITAVKAATRLKHAPLSRAVSLDKPIDADEGELTLADLLPAPTSSNPEAAVVSADELESLRRHFGEVLSDLESQVLRHHLEGKTYEEIAAMLQRHVKAIDNALQRIRRKVQAHLDRQRAAVD